VACSFKIVPAGLNTAANPDVTSPVRSAKASMVDSLDLYPDDYDTFMELTEIYHRIRTLDEEINVGCATSANGEYPATYEAQVDRLAAHLLDVVKASDLYLTDEAVNEFGIRDICSGDYDPATIRDAALTVLTTNDAAFAGVIAVYLTCREPTLIDSFFNASRLNLYREFIGIDREEVIRKYEAVMTLLGEYENLAAYRP
jgi:hypothetical protein